MEPVVLSQQKKRFTIDSETEIVDFAFAQLKRKHASYLVISSQFIRTP